MKEFNKIIGYSKEKAELEQIADIIRNRKAYDDLGVRPPCGLLMYGEPGLGKTLMAKCLIEACGIPVYTCRKDEPNGKFVDTIKKTFEVAAENAPAIVFLDDVDKFANTGYSQRDAEEFVAVQACIDANKETGIFVLATANDIDKLPASLRRAGRFDRIMEISPPNVKDAVGIINHYLSEKKFVADVDTKLLAKIMCGRSCAQLETVINEAGIYAGRERAKSINMDHILRACVKTVFSTAIGGRPQINIGMLDDDDDDDYDFASVKNQSSPRKEIVACHEIGHTIVSEVLFPGSVTIVALTEGGAGEGFTSCYWEETCDVAWIKSRAITSLGGMAATEQIYGIEDLGNVADLHKAFSTIDSMVTRGCMWGLGYKNYGYTASQARKQKTEELVGAIVEKYNRKAKEIIAKNREFFDKLLKALLEKGMLVEGEIAEIRKTCKITPVAID